MMLGPQFWLVVVLLFSAPATYGIMWIKRERAVHAAYTSGKRVGAEEAAVAVNVAARERVAAVVEGETAAPTISADRAERIKQCAQQASCRERGR